MGFTFSWYKTLARTSKFREMRIRTTLHCRLRRGNDNAELRSKCHIVEEIGGFYQWLKAA